MHKRGKSQLSVKSFLTQSTEELRSGTLLCFSKFLVSRVVTDSRHFSRLPLETFLSNKTKKFVGDFFCVPEKFRYQEVFEITEGISQFFRRKFFVSEDREIP